MGDFLIVGLNSDRSVRSIKGPGQPIQPERDRKEILAALECVDAVVVFRDPTPIRLIRAIRPDVLVKGADWSRKEIVGADFVNAMGGKVVRIPITPGKSTRGLLRNIRNTARKKEPSSSRTR